MPTFLVAPETGQPLCQIMRDGSSARGGAVESAGKTQLVLGQLATWETCRPARTLSSLPGQPGGGWQEAPLRSPAASAGGALARPAPQQLRTHLGPLGGTGPAGNSFMPHQSRLPKVPASFAASTCLKLPLLPQNRKIVPSILGGGGEASGQVSRWRLGRAAWLELLP